jgi:hypothetical protein
MYRKLLIPAALGAVLAAAFAPTIASAQSFGVYVGSGNPGYYDDDERREAWVAHERHEQLERWEQEQARRQYWQHQRWERDHEARRDWDRDRWEHRHDRQDENDDE